MIADVVELPIGIEEIPPKVVSQRHAGIKTDADTTVERFVAHGGYAQIFIEPLIPLLVGRIRIPESGVFHQLVNVRRITVCLELVHEGQHGHGQDVDE